MKLEIEKIQISSDLLTCPYCYYEHGDCWELTMGQCGTEFAGEVDCSRCGEFFKYEFSTSVTWTSEKKD